MIKQYSLILILACWSTAHAQYDSKGKEYSRFKPGFMWHFTGVRPAKPEKPVKYDRLIIDVVYNDWIGDHEPFQNHWSSIGLNTNIMFDLPLTKGNTVSIGIGLAHQFIKVRHDNNLIGDDLAGKTVYLAKDTLDTFNKSMLCGNSFSIPLELRFRKASWKHFKIHLGGRFGYRTNLFNKIVYKGDAGKDIIKNVGYPDQNDWAYSAHVRIGLRNWALYGSYSINTLFRSNESVKLNILQFGLSISVF